MFCGKCGAEIAPGAKFCGACGEPVSESAGGSGMEHRPIEKAGGSTDKQAGSGRKIARGTANQSLPKNESLKKWLKWILIFVGVAFQIVSLFVPLVTIIGERYLAGTSWTYSVWDGWTWRFALIFIILAAAALLCYCIKRYGFMMLTIVLMIIFYIIFYVGAYVLYVDNYASTAAAGPAMFIYPVAVALLIVGRHMAKKDDQASKEAQETIK